MYLLRVILRLRHWMNLFELLCVSIKELNVLQVCFLVVLRLSATLSTANWKLIEFNRGQKQSETMHCRFCFFFFAIYWKLGNLYFDRLHHHRNRLSYRWNGLFRKIPMPMPTTPIQLKRITSTMFKCDQNECWVQVKNVRKSKYAHFPNCFIDIDEDDLDLKFHDLNRNFTCSILNIFSVGVCQLILILDSIHIMILFTWTL